MRLGTSSRDTQVCGIVSLPEETVVRRVRNCLGRPDFEDFRAARKETADGSGGADGVRSLAGASGSGSAGSADGARSSDGADGSDSAGSADGVRSLAGADGSGSASGAASIVVEISLSPADFVTETVRYDRQPPVDPRAAAMSDDELLHMAMGAFNPKGGVLSVVGNAGSSVAGSAGETAHVPGVRPYVMADGPAGLRIAENYFEDAKGVHSMLPPMPLSLLPFATGPLKWALKIMTPRPGRGTEVRHQYCTAIPIGTAIAQSWSTEFAELCGDIVGEEMERFGVDLWLAPALNIHRSIRCGRNFEYYSEDPLLSGKMAAGVTRGVQRHPGRAVTIKHFAANNQEFNRTSSNSLVSERAMREIYLRGFEICVKESAPRAVMSSYNLINGVHASERRDLLEDILRAEFGFRGFVMTDWVIDGGMIPKDARYRSPVCALVAAAGNDVYMPGSREDFARLTKEFGEGQVTRRQLEINATRVLRCMD